MNRSSARTIPIGGKPVGTLGKTLTETGIPQQLGAHAIGTPGKEITETGRMPLGATTLGRRTMPQQLGATTGAPVMPQQLGAAAGTLGQEITEMGIPQQLRAHATGALGKDMTETGRMPLTAGDDGATGRTRCYTGGTIGDAEMAMIWVMGPEERNS